MNIECDECGVNVIKLDRLRYGKSKCNRKYALYILVQSTGT